MFSGGTVLPDSMETELGTRGFSISRKEYWGSFIAWECVPAAISAGVEIFEVPWRCHLLWQISSQWGSQKLLNFESHNSKTYLYKYLRSSFELVACESPWVKLSWHFCSVWDKPRWLNWFKQFLCEGLSFVNPKGFS